MLEKLTAFRQAFAPGEIVRPATTVLLVAAAVWAVLHGIDLPEWFRTLLSLVIGYWFGSQGVPGGRR